ncbi:MAG: hypothetical protein NEA02_10635 [Thermoanaerobaculia bacterium]|nr:hypothetical protein [Thermoanaerobaculia bacterium]
MKTLIAAFLVTIVVSASGCASVVHGTTQAVPVNSSPVGASVKVNCGKSVVTANTLTPTTVRLKRNAEPCNITLSKEGYEDASLVFLRSVSGWFWGNILIGGVVGMIIDGADGAIYNRSPESASLSLALLNPATPRTARTEFYRGRKILTKDGALVGEVAANESGHRFANGTTSEAVQVNLPAGGSIWMTKDEARAMTAPANLAK